MVLVRQEDPFQEVQSGKKHEVPFELVERSVNQDRWRVLLI